MTGKRITLPPLGTQQEAGSLPMNILLSPDGRHAVISDMGLHEALYAVSSASGKVESRLDFPNDAERSNGLYYGLAFAPDGTLYAAQGARDAIAKLSLSRDGRLVMTGSIRTRPHDFPAGIAIDGRGVLYAANNDAGSFAAPSSVALYRDGAEVGRYTFAETVNGTPNFPLAIAALRDGSSVYVASQRDGEVYVLEARDPSRPVLRRRISTGSHPVALLLNAQQSLLYVANADSDTVSVVSTASDRVVDTLLVRSGRLAAVAGASPVALALAPDGRTLYIALADMNAIAAAAVQGESLTLRGYLPAGWYPSGVAVTRDGKHLLFLNAKGTTPRHANPGYRQGGSVHDPSYGLNLIRGNVSFVRTPAGKTLRRFTREVLANNQWGESAGAGGNAAAEHALDAIGLKSGHIKHVIYIVKENRAYDQVLGDLEEGNGDPGLVLFGRAITPNQHALARRFALLDNFYVEGEVSGDGWPWSTESMANEYVERNVPYHYSDRGRNYDFEGQNNGYLTGGHPAKDPDGKTLSAAFPEGAPAVPDVAEAPGGHIWDAVRAAGLSYRNYGFYYSFGESDEKGATIPDNYPAARGVQPPGRDLAGISDFDFRRFDVDYADGDGPRLQGCPYVLPTYGDARMPSRFAEWQREFRLMLAKDPTGNSVPAFMTVRLMNDHTEGFAAGKPDPRAKVADNDYAVGQLVEAVSQSPIWESTAIFIVEDDAQDGADHVDSHRSPAFVISPWIRAHAIDPTFYNTDSVLKTMEMLLGIGPLTQYDAIARPIGDWTEGPENNAPYEAILPERPVVCEKTPPVAAFRASDPMRTLVVRSSRMDFVHPDSAPAERLNEILWKGIKGADVPLPRIKHGLLGTGDN